MNDPLLDSQYDIEEDKTEFSSSGEGDCYPVFPLNCQSNLFEDTVYYQFIYVPKAAIERTLTALNAAGHYCQVSFVYLSPGEADEPCLGP